MKACPHCGAGMADAAARCAECGMGPGDRVVRELRQTDEPLGFKRDPQVLTFIVFFLALLVGGLIVWFWG